MIKLALFDIDRTLVPQSTDGLAPETEEALLELKRRGVKTAIASGRQWQFLQPELKALPFDYYVMANGAYVTDGEGTPLCRQTADPATTDALIQDAKDLGCSMYLRYVEGVYCANDGEPDKSPAERWKEYISCSFLPENPLDKGQQPVAYWFFTPEESEKSLREKYPQLDFVRVLGGLMCDVNIAGISKATGLEMLCQLLGIEREETIAFGDDYNDLEMIREAGVGVAMGGSVPEVIAVADYVTDTCENLGVVKALQHFGLIG